MKILEKLKAGINNSKTIPFHSGNLKIRLLSEHEMQQCRIDSEAYAKKNELDDESEMIERGTRQLFVSLSDEDGNKCAESLESFRKLITRGEREYLVGEYLALENESLPAVPGLSNAEFEDILEEVKKNPDSILNSSNIPMLKRLIRYLENRRQS